MKKIRVISLILVAVLALGMFSSCGKHEFPKGDQITVNIIVKADPRVYDPDNAKDMGYTDEDMDYIVGSFDDIKGEDVSEEFTTNYSTVLGVMNEVLENKGLDFTISDDGSTFSSISTYTECAASKEASGTYWNYRVNKTAGKIAETTEIKDGDVIIFYFDTIPFDEDAANVVNGVN